MTRISEWITNRADDWREATWIGRGFIILVALVAIALLVGAAFLIYNARTITGTIEGKDYTPAHSQVVTQCVPVGSNPCQPMVTTQYVPDSWTVTVSPDNGTANVYRSVTESYWNTAQPGDRWAD